MSITGRGQNRQLGRMSVARPAGPGGRWPPRRRETRADESAGPALWRRFHPRESRGDPATLIRWIVSMISMFSTVQSERDVGIF